MTRCNKLKHEKKDLARSGMLRFRNMYYDFIMCSYQTLVLAVCSDDPS